MVLSGFCCFHTSIFADAEAAVSLMLVRVFRKL